MVGATVQLLMGAFVELVSHARVVVVGAVVGAVGGGGWDDALGEVLEFWWGALSGKGLWDILEGRWGALSGEGLWEVLDRRWGAYRMWRALSGEGLWEVLDRRWGAVVGGPCFASGVGGGLLWGAVASMF